MRNRWNYLRLYGDRCVESPQDPSRAVRAQWSTPVRALGPCATVLSYWQSMQRSGQVPYEATWQFVGTVVTNWCDGCDRVEGLDMLGSSRPSYSLRSRDAASASGPAGDRFCSETNMQVVQSLPLRLLDLAALTVCTDYVQRLWSHL